MSRRRKGQEPLGPPDSVRSEPRVRKFVIDKYGGVQAAWDFFVNISILPQINDSNKKTKKNEKSGSLI